jgi:hypothetical protein
MEIPAKWLVAVRVINIEQTASNRSRYLRGNVHGAAG